MRLFSECPLRLRVPEYVALQLKYAYQVLITLELAHVVRDHAKHLRLWCAHHAYKLFPVVHPYRFRMSSDPQQRRKYLYVIHLHVRILAYDCQRPLVHYCIHCAENLKHNLRGNHVDGLQNFNRPYEIPIQVLLKDVKIGGEVTLPLLLALRLSVLIVIPQQTQLLQRLRLLFIKPERRRNKLAYHLAQILCNTLSKKMVHQRVGDALDVCPVSASAHDDLEVE